MSELDRQSGIWAVMGTVSPFHQDSVCDGAILVGAGVGLIDQARVSSLETVSVNGLR